MPQRVPHPSRFNALKHGLRSDLVLLPGDNVAEFRRLRRRLFESYQPRTADEATCVEGIAAHTWRIGRCRGWRSCYDALETGLLSDQVPHVSNPYPHNSLHGSMDCAVDEARLRKMLRQDRAELFELQRMRRLNLIDGASALQDYRVFLAEGDAPAEAAEGQASGLTADGSNDGEMGDSSEPTTAPLGPQRPRVSRLPNRGRGGDRSQHPALRRRR